MPVCASTVDDNDPVVLERSQPPADLANDMLPDPVGPSRLVPAMIVEGILFLVRDHGTPKLQDHHYISN